VPIAITTGKNNISNLATTELSAQKTLQQVFYFLAFVGLCIRAAGFINLVDLSFDGGDETTYVLIARSLMQGHLPYFEAFDHKPIALYYIFALFFQVFGYSYETVRLMPFVAIGLTTWLLYLIVKKHWPIDQRSSALSIILFMATCSSFGNGGHVSNTEILQMPAIAAWWWAALNYPPDSRRRALLLGTFVGLITQINYLGGFAMALSTAILIAWPLSANRGWSQWKQFLLDASLSLIAFLAVVTVTLLPLILAGALGQYFGLQATLLGGYAGKVNADKLIRAAISISASSAFFALLIWCNRWRTGQWLPLNGVARRTFFQVGASFAITLVVIALTRRLYPHYFNLLVVPSTLLLLILFAHANPRSLRSFLAPAILMGALLLTRGAWDVYIKDWHNSFKDQNETKQLAEFIQVHTQPGDRVLLLGLNHSLYFMAEVTPATKFFFRDQIFAADFLKRNNSNPENEIMNAMHSEPILVMMCFDNLNNDRRAMIKSHLNEKYSEIAPPTKIQCKLLSAYVRK